MNNFSITPDSEIYELFPFLVEKFVVDFVNGIDIANDHIRVRSDRTDFMRRIYDGFTGKNMRRQNEINKSLINGVESSLKWLQNLTKSLSLSNIALAKSYARITELQKNMATLAHYSADLKEELNRFAKSVDIRYGQLKEEIKRVDFEQRVSRQIAQVFNKWKAGNFSTLSVSGRLYAVLDELWWGAFGDYYRNYTDNNHTCIEFLNDIRNRARIQLREDLQIENKRLKSDIWLSTSVDPNSDVILALEYLGNWSVPDKHPFVFSVTQYQNNLPLPLGLPRIFNESRLADAMIYEVFEERT